MFEEGFTLIFSSKLHNTLFPSKTKTDIQHQKIKVIPIPSDNNEFTKAIFSIEDVSDFTKIINEQKKLYDLAQEEIQQRKKAENELKKSEKQYKELNATKDKLFSIIGHDLRSPFHQILSFSDLLLNKIDKYDINKISEFIGYIQQTSKKAYNLLENLLIWARSQTGNLMFNPNKIDIKPIIEDNIELFITTAKNKQINIVSSVDKSIFAFADENMIKTVIRNLISNAIKFTSPKGKIEINILSLDNLVQISVVDNGVGIDNKKLKTLFKINRDVTTYGTNNEPGTGLGLIICKEFIEKNKGKIIVKSKKGEGSKFIITIPKVI